MQLLKNCDIGKNLQVSGVKNMLIGCWITFFAQLVCPMYAIGLSVHKGVCTSWIKGGVSPPQVEICTVLFVVVVAVKLQRLTFYVTPP